MKPYKLGDVNRLASFGFFLSLIGAQVMGLLLYLNKNNYGSLAFALQYLIITPLIQVTGLISSIKSIPYVEEWGDKDYAEGGLCLNILFLSLYAVSLLYFLGWVWIPKW